MSLIAITQKELGDLLREKRFGAWALIFLSLWTLFLFVLLTEMRQSPYPRGVSMLLEPAYFFYAIAFVVLALFTLSDGITKERESGMLALVGAKPIVRWHVPLAKLLAGLAVYVGTFVVTLLPAAVLVAAVGLPAMELLARLYVGPLLALYVFLLGLGLLLGTVATSSKVAIGSAAGLMIPLFLAMTEGPFSFVYRSSPAAAQFARYTPFQATWEAARVTMHGGQMPWAPLLLTAFLGVALCAAAFWAFSRQEVAA